jgi:hypothetical protein
MMDLTSLGWDARWATDDGTTRVVTGERQPARVIAVQGDRHRPGGGRS